MPFRIKLLIVLLALSLVPILFMRINGMGALQELVARYVPLAREYAIKNHEEQLENIAENYSYSNALGGSQIQLLLYVQAQAVEQALASNPWGTGSALFTPSSKEQAILVNSAKPDVDHYRVSTSGERKELHVSYAEQVMETPGGNGNVVSIPEYLLLRKMTPVYQRMSLFTRHILLWQITCLENGLFSIYPGVGQMPSTYDPRESVWYKQSKQTGTMQWTLAHTDPISKSQIITMSMPVKYPDGRFAGVTAVHVPISLMLERQEIISQVPPNTMIILASYEKYSDENLQPPKTTNGQYALIIAKPDHEGQKRGHWRHPAKPEFLSSMHNIPFKAMVMDLKAARSGSQRMEYEGKDSLWTYAPMDGTTFLVMITPYEEILAPVSQVEHEVLGNVSDLINLVTLLGLGIMIVVVIVSVILSRTVTKPLLALANASAKLGEGDFDARVKIKSRDEFGRIGKAFNALGPRLKENYELRQALALAMEVQQRLLPQGQPETQNLDVFGKSVYCDETGGDYYDFIVGPCKGCDGLYVVVGDVSGHGLPAALLMASARAFLRQRISMEGDLNQILADVNRQLALDVYQTGRFMTLLMCRFHESIPVMSWARAGHDPPMIYDPVRDEFDEPSEGGLPLGVLNETEFTESDRLLDPGQIVFLGTDGIWETHNAAGDFFGKQRVRDCIRRNKDKSARDIVHGIVNELNTFRGEAERDDDITLIAVKVKE